MFFNNFPEYAELYEKGGAVYLTTQMDRSINFSKNGILIFKRAGGELSSQAMWQLSDLMKDDGKTQISLSPH